MRRETSEPGASPQGLRGPAGALPGIRAAGLPGGGPAPQHPAPPRQGRLDRGGKAAASSSEIASELIRWGRRIAYRLLRLEEGLQRPTPRKRKRARPADRSVRRHRAEHPHQVWAMDFQFGATADGRRLKFLNVIDEHSRLRLAIRVGRCCKAPQCQER